MDFRFHAHSLRIVTFWHLEFSRPRDTLSVNRLRNRYVNFKTVGLVSGFLPGGRSVQHFHFEHRRRANIHSIQAVENSFTQIALIEKNENSRQPRGQRRIFPSAIGVERADFFQRRLSEGINNCPARTSSL